jgi:hypothetical protein
MTTYDPEDQAERRRLGGLLQEYLQRDGEPKFVNVGRAQLNSQNFCTFLNQSGGLPLNDQGMGVTAESM